MGFLSFLRRRKKDPFEGRRDYLLENGRITDGVIIDTETKPNGDEIVYYIYSLNGVDFESSELLTAEQKRDPLKFAPGAKVGVRYDPRNQGNSTLA
ncbi:MAG TPA: hypothetical protein PKD26_09295 [Pyrinomonadaceae bacterium]|nr:hypothetical protein [Pyrinomonadaceae bacterium]